LNLTGDSWEVYYDPLFLLFIAVPMLIISIELTTYARLIFRSGIGRIKYFAMTYFIGWVVLASSGGVFLLSRLDYRIPSNFWMIFFSFGVLIISFVMFINPANLIASPLKVFYITFVDNESGLPYLSYNFRKGEMEIEPTLFSGVLVGISLALKETVKGNRYLKKIDGIDRKILLERGLQTQAILTVEDETILFRRILKRLLILFEMEFYTFLDNVDGIIDSDIYSDFSETIKTYFAFAY
jgi:hypothetical protein